jgi:CDP-glucose 4,6-dehydratase
MKVNETFWTGKRVFLTGHTGFKGGWLALWLTHLGADVCGYALEPSTTPNLFDATSLSSRVKHTIGDIRDQRALESTLQDFAPEVIFHLAAQPLVRASYSDPIETYETNVIGTAKLLDAVRRTASVRAIVSVTTDKCYENKEWVWGYRETDPLGGFDPYSSSKACAEIVSAAFRQSYFPVEKYGEHGVALATARAGNVIGGGDWSTDRLIPDLIRGFRSGHPVAIRRPRAIRPWQHVLEPLHGYIALAEKLLSAEGAKYAKAYNFGPADSDAQPVEWIVNRLVKQWGQGASWYLDAGPSVHEAGYLKLDASLARADLDWSPTLDLGQALDWLVTWYQAHAAAENMREVTLEQISSYENLLAQSTSLRG